MQAAWLVVFGFFILTNSQRVLAGDLGCFYELGTYRVCEATELLSIHSTLFLLMAQAMISRIFAPGVSNFVNASVRVMLNFCHSDL